MTENEFLLADRIQKIKSMNELYDLENNAKRYGAKFMMNTEGLVTD